MLSYSKLNDFIFNFLFSITITYLVFVLFFLYSLDSIMWRHPIKFNLDNCTTKEGFFSIRMMKSTQNFIHEWKSSMIFSILVKNNFFSRVLVNFMILVKIYTYFVFFTFFKAFLKNIFVCFSDFFFDKLGNVKLLS